MEIMWPFILSIISGLSTLLGTIPLFFKIKDKDSFITFSLAFSLSVMITISIFDLIPSSIKYINGNYWYTLLIFILFFSLGYLLTNILNNMIEKEKESNNLYKVGILSFITLILHNLPEGILTFLSTYKDFHLGLSLCIAISLHNIPEGISIAVPIYYSKKSRGKALLMTLFSAVSEPLGALLAFIILRKYVTNEIISIFLIFISGIMITLSIEKILPLALTYKKEKPLLSGLIIGFIIASLSIIIL